MGDDKGKAPLEAEPVSGDEAVDPPPEAIADTKPSGRKNEYESPTARFKPEIEFAPGNVLGRLYRIVRHIGSGAQGDVYEVEHVRLGTRFAAKLLLPHLASHPTYVARLEREAIAASQIEHPNIARVVNFDQTENGQSFVIMELLRGDDLGGIMRRESISAREACAIAADIASALDAAHAAGIVHRDLKPSNLFLVETPEGRNVKLTDFGISKLLDAEERQKLTSTGSVIGTPMYMAPEQATGEAVDHRADIYALGVVLFEMLTGRLPYRGTTFHQLLYQKVSIPPPTASDIRPEIPKALSDIIQKAMARDPNERYQRMRELRKDLLELLPLVPPETALARPVHTPEPSMSTLGSTGRLEAAPSPDPAVSRRLTVALAFFVVCAVALGLLASSSRETAPIHGERAPESARSAAGPGGDSAPARDTAIGETPRASPPRVTILSDPEGAEVIGPDGKSRGRAPLEIELEAAGRFRLVREGGETVDVDLDPERDGGQRVRVIVPDRPRAAVPPPVKSAPRKAKAPRKPIPVSVP